MKKGFTLIELLVASAIFVIIMTLVTGIFGSASSYYVKLKEARATLIEGQRIDDMIATDVRMANGTAEVTSLRTKVSEFALLSCDNSALNCTIKNNNYVYDILNNGENVIMSTLQSPFGFASYDQNNVNDLLIIQRSQDKYVRYHSEQDGSNPDNFVIKRYESSPIPSFIPIIGSGSWEKLNSQVSVRIVFNGLVELKNQDRKTQPYVRFATLARTKDYSITAAPMRSSMIYANTIISRDYNP